MSEEVHEGEQKVEEKQNIQNVPTSIGKKRASAMVLVESNKTLHLHKSSILKMEEASIIESFKIII